MGENHDNQTYFYMLSAVNAAGECEPSEEVSVTPIATTSGGIDQALMMLAVMVVIAVIASVVLFIMKRKK